MTPTRRTVNKLLDDILLAAEMAEEIARRGREQFDSDRINRLAAEAVIGRIGDGASKLPAEIRAALPDVPWNEIIGARIHVDHIYHRLDYDLVWDTISEDIPKLRAAIEGYRDRDGA